MGIRRWRPKWVILGLSLVLLGETVLLVRWAWLAYWSRAGVTVETRGYRLALRFGCFTCHGPGAAAGMTSPVGEVPPWDGGTWMMYARTEEEIRNWIRYGARRGPEGESGDEALQRRRLNPDKLFMPAYGDRLTKRQVEELTAFYKAVAWFRRPDDPEVDRGREIAADRGCFHCHGPEGRLNFNNPGSFKGYIPAWYGPDFRELVRNDEELREWILDGVSHRIAANPAARFFLKRQKIRMPRYRGKLTDGELQALIAYIHWLQEGS